MRPGGGVTTAELRVVPGGATTAPVPAWFGSRFRAPCYWSTRIVSGWEAAGMPRPFRSHEEWERSFWTHVKKTDTCWNWTPASGRNGYGRFRALGESRRKMVHRIAYELLVGPVPLGLQLDHLCRNRACVNPAHLEPVTHRENVLRGVSRTAVNALKTHCINGHKFTEENTYVGARGWRECRTCHRIRSRVATLASAGSA